MALLLLSLLLVLLLLLLLLLLSLLLLLLLLLLLDYVTRCRALLWHAYHTAMQCNLSQHDAARHRTIPHCATMRCKHVTDSLQVHVRSPCDHIIWTNSVTHETIEVGLVQSLQSVPYYNVIHYLFVCSILYIYIYTCIYTCIYIYIYTYMCIYIYNIMWCNIICYDTT